MNLSVSHTFRPSSIEIQNTWCDELTTELKDKRNITVLTIKTTTPTEREFIKNKQNTNYLKLELGLGLNNKYIKKNKIFFKKANYKESHEDERIQLPLGAKFCIKVLKEIINEWNHNRSAIVAELVYERVTGATINKGWRETKVPFKWNNQEIALGQSLLDAFDGKIPESFSIEQLEYLAKNSSLIK